MLKHTDICISRGGEGSQHDGLTGRPPYTDISAFHRLLLAACSMLHALWFLLPAPADHHLPGAQQGAVEDWGLELSDESLTGNLFSSENLQSQESLRVQINTARLHLRLPYSLQDFQMNTVAALSQNNNVILVAPTGVGKSVIIDMLKIAGRLC